MRIFIDIETVPAQDPAAREEIAAAVQPPAPYKKPESIAQWLAENREAEAEAAWLKTSFDGGAGQCCVIGWAIDDEPAKSLHVADLARVTEYGMLAEFFAQMGMLTKTHGTRPVVIGHNLIGFDLPFLLKRCFIHNVKPPLWWPRNPKPWSEVVDDTMLLWDANQRAGGSMARLCKLLGIEGKGDIDGSMVWPMVRAGRIAEVAEYCRGDVERTRAIYKRLTFAD